MTRCDAALTTNQAALERVEAFLRLVSDIFTGPRVRVLPMRALGTVAYRRWTAAGHPTMPDGMSLRRLRQTNWDRVVSAHAGVQVSEVRAPVVSAQADAAGRLPAM